MQILKNFPQKNANLDTQSLLKIKIGGKFFTIFLPTKEHRIFTYTKTTMLLLSQLTFKSKEITSSFNHASSRMIQLVPLMWIIEYKLLEFCTSFCKICQNLHIFKQKLSKFALFEVHKKYKIHNILG